MTTSVNQICIIGTGLIGGSLALALKKSGFCHQITASGRTEKTLKTAQSLGIIDSYDLDMAKAVAEADIVMVSVPLGVMKSVFEQIQPGLKESAVVTDAGSAKQCVINDAEAALKNSQRFVAGHPIAGTEKSGAEAAFDSLYNNRKVILTPVVDSQKNTDADAIALIKSMWQSAGAEVEMMDAQHHDLVLAGTSHLPHLLAFGLVDCLNKLDDVDEIFKYAAGGFRDFTRIASSDPDMWRDICLSNRDEVLEMMDLYKKEMKRMYKALEKNDGEKLKEIFKRAKQTRDTFNN